MTVRVTIVALLVVGSFFAADALKGRSMPTEAAHLQRKLDSMPRRFESWTGTDLPLSTEISEAIGAESVVNRSYHDQTSNVELHCDAFTDEFMQYGVRIIHSPENCSPSSGLTVDNAETVEITPSQGAAHAARLLTLSRQEGRVFCLYWYQVGDATFWDSDGQRNVVHSFRGRATWPPMIKVMLQTNADSPAEAERRLKSLGVLVYPWVAALH